MVPRHVNTVHLLETKLRSVTQVGSRLLVSDYELFRLNLAELGLQAVFMPLYFAFSGLRTDFGLIDSGEAVWRIEYRRICPAASRL